MLFETQRARYSVGLTDLGGGGLSKSREKAKYSKIQYCANKLILPFLPRILSLMVTQGFPKVGVA